MKNSNDCNTSTVHHVKVDRNDDEKADCKEYEQEELFEWKFKDEIYKMKFTDEIYKQKFTDEIYKKKVKDDIYKNKHK